MIHHQTALFVASAFLLLPAPELRGQSPTTRSTNNASLAHQAAIPVLTNSGGINPGQSNRRGAELARQYCSACHLFPDPQLLTKREWAHHVLPQMALWLGVEPVNYENEKDGRLLEEAGLFTSSPMLPEQDWFAIWDYYVSNAPSTPLSPPDRPPATTDLKSFRVRKLNFHEGTPMISLVKIDPAQKRLFVGDAFARILAVVDPAGRTLGTAQLSDTPVSLNPQTNGGFITLIGRMFPSDALEGSVMFVPKGAAGSAQTLLEKLRRPTHTAVGDLNADGRMDLVVCQFGHRLGRLSWFEATAHGPYDEHVLLEQPGALRSELRDLNGDGKPDIIVQVAQAREGIYVFYNQGRGQFRMEPIIEQPPTFGSAAFELADFNRDGFPDILLVNGDNGDYPTPHKPYHGLRIYLNDGTNHFKESWFHPLEGAYDARAADFDGDGDLDLAAIAYFPDFQKQPVENFVYLENLGGFRFQPRALREAGAGRWMTMDVGDLDGDGDQDIALGSFTTGPTTIPIPGRVRDHWKTNGAAVLLLENQAR